MSTRVGHSIDRLRPCSSYSHVSQVYVDTGVSSHLLKTEAGLQEEWMISVINEEVIGR